MKIDVKMLRTIFIVKFFHRKSVMHKQDRINEYKPIRNKYIRNNKKRATWGFHWVIVEEPGLLSCCTVWLGNLFTTFRGKVGKQLFQTIGAIIKTFFNWFIPVVCEYNVKYLRDIRKVRQNTTLYYDVMCQRTDNMFRLFTIRPSSGLTSRAKEEILKL